MLSGSQVIPVRVVAWTFLLLVALVAPGACADGEESDVQPVRTAKERLGVKASDEQRVDNCKVSVDLRGPKSRPDECGDGASTRMFVSCGPSTAQPVAVFNFELIDTSLEGAVRGARADEASGRDFAPRSSIGTLQLSTRCSSLALTPSRSFAVRITPTSLASPSARAIAPGATNATSTRSIHGTTLTGIT
jgi:hypothetical protein